QQTIFSERAGPRQAENRVWRRQPGALHSQAKPRGTTGQCHGCCGEAVIVHTSDYGLRFSWDANCGGAEAAGRRNDLSPDERMQMVVLMHVDMIQRKAGTAKRCELRLDLRAQLQSHARRSHKIESQPDEIAAHSPRTINQPRNSRSR